MGLKPISCQSGKQRSPEPDYAPTEVSPVPSAKQEPLQIEESWQTLVLKVIKEFNSPKLDIQPSSKQAAEGKYAGGDF